MRIKIIALVFGILSALLAPLAQAGAAPATDFSVGGESLYSIEVDPTKLLGSLVFRLVFPRKLLPDEDISLSARPAEPRSDPDIYVYNQYPGNNVSPIFESISLGTDVILIPFSHMETNLPMSQNLTSLEELKEPIKSEYYVHVECFRSCSFYFSADYSKETFFELGSPESWKPLRKEIFLKNTNSFLLKVNIPKNNSIDRIRFDLNLLEIKKRQEPFEIFFKMGNDKPSSTNTDHVSLPNWDFGKTIAIERGGKFFCVGCNYTILIEGERNSKLTFEARADEKTRMLSMFQSLHDVVLRGKTNIYRVPIPEDNIFSRNIKTRSIYVTLNVYSGNPSLYLNPDAVPEGLDAYRWSTDSEYTKVLVISPKERAAVNATDQLYYIAVHGNKGSAYSLTFTLNKNNDGRMLKPGLLETGWALKNELVNYNLKISGAESFQVSVRLIAKQGNPDLYIKLCDTNKKSNCGVSLNEVENKVPEDSSPLFLFSNKEGSVDFLEFKHENGKCNGGKGGSCFYAITVIGSSVERSSFELTVFYENQHVLLMENSLNKVTLARGERKFFKFLLQGDEDVNKVSFIVTPINGDIRMSVSRTNRFPDKRNEDDIEYRFSGYIDLVSFKKEDSASKSLKGEFFVSCFGESAAFFTLRVTVGHAESNNTKVTNFISNLEDGVPQDYALENANELHYFKISLGEERNDEEVLIQFLTYTGKFELLVNFNSSLPSNTSFFARSAGSDFVIRPTEETVRANPKGEYTVLVLPVVEAQNNQTGAHFEFSIQYSLYNSLKLLKINQPYNETLKKRSSRFKYEFLREVSASSSYSLVLSPQFTTDQSLNSSNLILYGSFSSENNYPTAAKNDFVLSADTRVLQLKDAQLSGCSSALNCLIYVTVFGQPGMDFSLLLKKDYDSTIITRDRLLELPLKPNTPEESVYLYNFLFNQESLVINAFAPGATLRIFARFIEKHTRKSDDYPSAENFDVSSGPEQRSVAFIPIRNCSELLKSSRPGLFKASGVLTIKIEVRKSAELEKLLNVSTLRVLISQGRDTQLVPDFPVVSLNNRPRESQNFSFYSKSENLSQVAITSLTYCKRLNRSENFTDAKKYLNSSWEVPCLYSLNRLRYQEELVTSIYDGVPLDLDLSPYNLINKRIQLEYDHGGETSFRVLLSKEFGDVAVTIDSSKSLAKNNRSFSQALKDNVFQEVIEVGAGRADFCVFCKYTINIYPLSNARLTAYVVSGYTRLALREGQTLQDGLGSRSKNSYVLFRAERLRLFRLHVQVVIGKIEVFIGGESQKGVSETRMPVDMGPDNYFVKEFDLESFENLRKNENSPVGVVVSGTPGSRFLISLTAQSNPKTMRTSVGIMEFLKSDKEASLQFNTDRWDKTNLTAISISLNSDQFDIDGFGSQDLRDLFPNPVLKSDRGYAYEPNVIQTERELLVLMPYSLKAPHNLTLRNSGFDRSSTQNSKAKAKPLNLVVSARLLTWESALMTRGERLLSPVFKGQPNFYSLSSDPFEPTRVLISIATCNQPVDIKVATRLEHLKSNVYDVSGVYTELEETRAIYEVEMKSAELYFSLSLKNKQAVEGLYSVSTLFLPESSMNPFQAFTPGGCSYTFDDAGTYEINADRLTCSRDNYCPSSNMMYKVYISDNKEVAERAPECGRELFGYDSHRKERSRLLIKALRAPQAAIDGRATGKLTSEELQKAGFNDYDYLFVKVVALVYLKGPKGKAQQEININYGTLVIPGRAGEAGREKMSGWAIFGIVLGALGGVFLIGLICWRCRKLRAEAPPADVEFKRPSVTSLTVTKDFEMNDRYQALVDNSHL